MPNLPWNEEDSDRESWGDFFAVVISAGVGVAMLIAGLTGQTAVRNDTPIPPSGLTLGGSAFLGLGSVLAIRGYGFTDRRRPHERRRGRSHARRR